MSFISWKIPPPKECCAVWWHCSAFHTIFTRKVQLNDSFGVAEWLWLLCDLNLRRSLFSCFRADLWSWMCGLLRRVASQTVKSTRSSRWPPPCCKTSCLLFLFRSDWGRLGSLCMQRALRCQPCYMLELQTQTAACSFKDVQWVTNHKV